MLTYLFQNQHNFFDLFIT